MSIIINLFGGPGIGKSTQAAGLYHKMKKEGISVEMPYEFPKVLAWDKSFNAVKDQLYVLANQHRNIVRTYGQVDYIIVDSPIMLSLVYKDRYNEEPEYPSSFYGYKFDEFIVDLHKRYDSINIVLERDDNMFKSEGRFQDLENSKAIDDDIVEVLNRHQILYYPFKVKKGVTQEMLEFIKSLK